MPKKITILSLNYAPEDTAIGLYSTQMAEHLHDLGWNVSVIAGFPYYPQWKIWDSYKKRRKYHQEVINGVKVLRYRQYVPSKLTFSKRVLQLIDFTLGSFFNTYKIREADVVLSIIPFTSSAWLGRLLANRLHAKHWVHIQDFEFDAAKESGMTNEKRLSKCLFTMLFKLESNILNSAHVVSTISHRMMNKLGKKSTSVRFYFPNWVDEEFINPSLAKQHEFLKTDGYKVLYSGNIGEKQDWDFFLKVVEKFKENEKVKFIVVGHGASKNKLKSATGHLRNVLHFEPVPYSELNDLLCSADLHILFQKKTILDTVMPSKILGMMASGIPSLVTGHLDSETATVFNNSKGGLYFDTSSLQEVINSIVDREIKLQELMGENAKKYVTAHFSKINVLNKFELRLTSLINEE
nr:WcaI family glycosyltransferase [uncultured Allomuricauda sp.]